MISMSGKFSRTICSRSRPPSAGWLHVGDEDVDLFAIHQRQPGLGRRGADDAVIAAQRV